MESLRDLGLGDESSCWLSGFMGSEVVGEVRMCESRGEDDKESGASPRLLVVSVVGEVTL